MSAFLYLQLLVCEVLSQLLGDPLQVLEGDPSSAVVVKQAEGLQDLLREVLLALRNTGQRVTKVRYNTGRHVAQEVERVGW